MIISFSDFITYFLSKPTLIRVFKSDKATVSFLENYHAREDLNPRSADAHVSCVSSLTVGLIIFPL